MKEILEKLNYVQAQSNYLASIRKNYEDEQIKVFLRIIFNMPEKKSENIISIDELLEKEMIMILIPKEIFEQVDFKQFNLPNKLQLILNTIDNEFRIMGVNDFTQKPFDTLLRDRISQFKEICYKSNEPCKYNCSGLCKESC